jgi:alpha-glucosidase (family GH31 glycosyl hydrolase)
MPDSLLIGDAIYAPIVTSSTERMDIELPPGEWIDYWHESRVVSGSLPGFPVPLGQEPIFIRAARSSRCASSATTPARAA